MVKPGYKQTEIGVIPEDWKVSTMESITSLMTNGFVGTIKSEYVPSGTGILYLQGFNIKENGFDLTGVTYVSDSFHKKHLKSELKENDLLTVQTGDIGVTSYLPKQFEGANCQALIISRFYDKYDSRFWSYYFNSTGRKMLKLIETGTTMKHINVGDMKGVLVPVPTTKEEQKRIAEALSDVDNMISSLEKLIAKKKAVKQGAMQELLTGKKRLPGFSGKWGKFKLGDLCCISGRIGFRGYTKDDLVNKGFGAITFSPSDIFEQKLDYSNCDYISFFKYDESPEIQVFNGDIIFCKTASIGKTALVKNLTEKATINPQFVLMNKFKCNNEFLYYIISGKEFVEQILSITGGSTIPTISQEQLKMQWICMPELDEQNVIASILSDMDNEIEALEQKLAKARQIKQGMMQQLLTGKIRLV